MDIKKGDNVKVIAGKDRGKTGAVLRIIAETNRIVVEGVNVVKKRMRPRKAGQQGETVSVARPLARSNVMILCGNCKKPARIGSRMEGNTKVRVCKRCDARL